MDRPEVVAEPMRRYYSVKPLRPADDVISTSDVLYPLERDASYYDRILTQ